MNNNKANSLRSCTIILLGATGDLAKRKLIPAIYSIISHKKLDRFVLVGAAIDDTSMDEILERSKEFIEHCDEHIWERLKKNASPI